MVGTVAGVNEEYGVQEQYSKISKSETVMIGLNGIFASQFIGNGLSHCLSPCLFA
jgi:hypothetical protein